MTEQVYIKPSLMGSARLGAALGLGAAWGIFGLVLAAGAQLGLPPGTFYEMIGVSLGVSEEWPAIYLGFGLHMLTGAIIGMVYMAISERIKHLRTFSTARWFGTGIATGVAIWAVLFVPLHFFLVQPALENMQASNARAERLGEMSDSILYGALAMHFVFGSMLGFFARIATSSREVAKIGVARRDAAAA
jgi:hypothetical protein